VCTDGTVTVFVIGSVVVVVDGGAELAATATTDVGGAVVGGAVVDGLTDGAVTGVVTTDAAERSTVSVAVTLAASLEETVAVFVILPVADEGGATTVTVSGGAVSPATSA
jgi:hypothetical protein